MLNLIDLLDAAIFLSPLLLAVLMFGRIALRATH